MGCIQWYIGCSGFHYREWKEVFYPKECPQRTWFSFYCQHFNTLELNVTFYKFPRVEALSEWYHKAPGGFLFSAKMPRAITHFKKFTETEQLVADFYGTLKEGLKEKMGCVLIQLPPQFAFSEEKLESIIRQADPSFTNVIEFRNISWWREDVYLRLTAANISFCGVSFPKIPFDDAVVNKSIVYYRFHGVPVLFHSPYEEDFLSKIHSQVANHPETRKAFIYFNNTASTAALHNARSFQRLALP